MNRAACLAIASLLVFCSVAHAEKSGNASSKSPPEGQNVSGKAYGGTYPTKDSPLLYSHARYFDIFNKQGLRESEACFAVQVTGTQLNSVTGKEEPIFEYHRVGPQNRAT